VSGRRSGCKWLGEVVGASECVGSRCKCVGGVLCVSVWVR
jgi:hypothetical protein